MKKGDKSPSLSWLITNRDSVQRKVMGNMKNPTLGNWAPIGKDPIRVTLVAVMGAYHLEDLEEISLP